MEFHSAIITEGADLDSLWDRLLDGAYGCYHTHKTNYHEMCCALQDKGYEIRDSILLIEPTGQHHLTLFKKPHKGTIVDSILANGTGGINIDKCRISFMDGESSPAINRYEGSASGNWDFNEDTNNGWKHSNRGGDFNDAARASMQLGRFPANLLLVHGKGCEVNGTKTIGQGTVRRGTNRKGRGEGTVFKQSGFQAMHQDAPDTYGAETVLDWVCEDNCPIRRLDAQSGDRPSFTGNNNAPIGENSKGVIKPMRRGKGIPRNDKGGASRFFKQVGSLADALAYITALITPTEGNCLTTHESGELRYAIANHAKQVRAL